MAPFLGTMCCSLVFLLRCPVTATASQAQDAQTDSATTCKPSPTGPARTEEDETSMLQTSQLVAKINRAQSLGADSSNRSSPSVYRQALENVEDVQYFASLQIGGQTMKGVLDTGSFEVLVIDKDCITCGLAAKHGYDHTASASFKAGHLVATHSFGSGDTTSEEGFDTVQIGPLTASQQNLWEVREASMSILDSIDFQAIVGVGPPNVPADEARVAAEEVNASLYKYPGGPTQAPESLKFEYKEMVEIAEYTGSQPALLESFHVQRFSVCFQRQAGAEGYFVWNDADPRAMPHVFTEFPVTGTKTWGLNLRNAQLAEKKGAGRLGVLDGSPGGLGGLQLGCEDGCGAIIDSGTSLLAVPPTVIAKVTEAMQRVHEDCSNIEELPSLTFEIDGQLISLPPDAYVGQIVGTVPEILLPFMPNKAKHSCDLLLMKQDSQTQFGPLWILGMPFFRHYYTTFDLGASKLDRKIFVAPADAQCNQPVSPALLGSDGPYTRKAKQGLRRVGAERLRLPPWATNADGRYLPI